MSLQGPIVVVTDQKDADLVAALAAEGAFPVVEASWRDAPNAIARIEPSAVVVAGPAKSPNDMAALGNAIEQAGDTYLPVVARVGDAASPPLLGALPVAVNASPARIAVRLASALRVRTLHTTELRRSAALAPECDDLPVMATTDPIEDATVIVTGRGRGYPALSTAVGERVGLIGALSVETAAKYLNARDVDGIVIGEGFNPRTVEAFLTVLGEDTRFRDIPIALLPDLPAAINAGKLPNLEPVGGDPATIVERILPLVRQHAFEARLQRQLTALEAKGMLDPETGLFTVTAFLRDLNRAVEEAKVRGNAMTLARFTFPIPVDRRVNMDAARLVSRLVRSADFACRASDGSILLAFSETALRSAHVVARRIANVLRHTMLSAEGDDGKPVRVDPTITLASLKSNDTVETLLARVSEPVAVAAQ
ncbi:MAG TPA: GGDEF domain-containing protein [Xanthobacteraceae bacterium]|nr:GGDEF domain-containing protein [Xanthobacteraceae bacterium]